jgi:hypothetical protein
MFFRCLDAVLSALYICVRVQTNVHGEVCLEFSDYRKAEFLKTFQTLLRMALNSSHHTNSVQLNTGVYDQ